MKKFSKILAIALVGALAVVSCKKDDPKPEPNIEITASPTSLSFTATDTAAKEVTVTSELTWEATKNADWVTITRSGETLSVKVAANEATEARTATITVDNGEKTATVTVNQAAGEPEPEPEPEEIKFVIADYWGDYFENGTYNFTLEMYTTEMDENEMATGDGYYMYIDFLSEEPLLNFPPNIASGTYNVSDDMRAFSILPGTLDEDDIYDLGSGVGPIVDGGLSWANVLLVVGGSFKVEDNAEGNYTISFDLELSDGSNFKAVWDGDFEVTNNLYPMDIEDDIVIPTMTGESTGIYWGYYYTGSKDYEVLMKSESLNDPNGSGDIVVFEFLPSDGDVTGLPEGTYPITDSEDYDTIVAGADYGGFQYASWYNKIIEGYIVAGAPLVAGDVTVSKESDIYTITFDAEDEEGHSITGSWVGEIEFDDRSGGYGIAPAKRSSSHAAGRTYINSYKIGKSKGVKLQK